MRSLLLLFVCGWLVAAEPEAVKPPAPPEEVAPTVKPKKREPVRNAVKEKDEERAEKKERLKELRAEIETTELEIERLNGIVNDNQNTSARINAVRLGIEKKQLILNSLKEEEAQLKKRK